MEPKNKNAQRNNKPTNQLVRLIGVNPTAWEEITAYIMDTPINFANAKRAAKIQDMLSQYIVVDVPANQIQKQTEEKKEPVDKEQDK